jgi:hypothetical protein
MFASVTTLDQKASASGSLVRRDVGPIGDERSERQDHQPRGGRPAARCQVRLDMGISIAPAPRPCRSRWTAISRSPARNEAVISSSIALGNSSFPSITPLSAEDPRRASDGLLRLGQSSSSFLSGWLATGPTSPCRRDLGEDQHGVAAGLGSGRQRLRAKVPYGHWRKLRHLIESFFCKLKEFKRVTMRSDKPTTLRSHTGSANITGTDRTAVYNRNHPSADSASPRITC